MSDIATLVKVEQLTKNLNLLFKTEMVIVHKADLIWIILKYFCVTLRVMLWQAGFLINKFVTSSHTSLACKSLIPKPVVNLLYTLDLKQVIQ